MSCSIKIGDKKCCVLYETVAVLGTVVTGAANEGSTASTENNPKTIKCPFKSNEAQLCLLRSNRESLHCKSVLVAIKG